MPFIDRLGLAAAICALFLMTSRALSETNSGPQSQLWPGVVSADALGADPTGKSDSTDAIMRAVTSIANSGGKVVFGPGSYHVGGTIALESSGITLEGIRGATRIVCTGDGTADCISIRGKDEQVKFITLVDLFVLVPERSGGNCLSIVGAYKTFVDNVVFGPCYNGVLTDWTNSATLSNFNVHAMRGEYGIKYTTSPSIGPRSDVLNLSNGTVQAHHLGADCLVWDGMAVSLRIYNVDLLGCKIGLHVQNTAKSKKDVPGFLFADHLATDGQLESAIVIEGGHEFHFINSLITNTSGLPQQGGKDGDCVVIKPDAGYSDTRNIFFVGSRIGICHNRAMYVDAHDVHLTGNNFHSASKGDKNNFPQIEIGPDASDVEIVGGKVGDIFGAPHDASYGVIVDRGARNVSITGVNFSGNTKGAVLSSDAGETNVTGGTDHLGRAIAGSNSGQ